FCDVPANAIISAEDISPFYAIPLNLHRQGLDETVLDVLRVEAPPADLRAWEEIVSKLESARTTVRIAAVGKYTGHEDAYKSINEAFVHAGIANNCRVQIDWIDSEQFENRVLPREALKEYDGIVIGPGFGSRGVEGKIKTVTYARDSQTPYFGICLGMQIACIELARNRLGLEDANTTEVDPETKNPVISLLSEQRGVTEKGGTMRLGAYRCDLKPDTRAYEAYGVPVIQERHRHRYEFNNAYRQKLEKVAGLVVSGTHQLGEHELVEIIELKDHPWFCASQFHPEFKSTPLKPQPLFREFVKAALAHQQRQHEVTREAAVS
ncbi:MAG: CTP synthase, partial [Candidatus Hydrogenedentales bacterium]